MLALIDYGAGNLTSVRKALTSVDVPFMTPDTPGRLAEAAGIIVPGVGHFGATRALGAGWRAGLLDAASRQVPVLGICLGLHYLFEGSAEAPEAPGLGLLAGRCALLPSMVKVPHVGWNALETTRTSRLLEGIAAGTQFYFAHSYAAPITRDSVATTIHGAPFAAAVEHGAVFGVQFHPEKSGDAGLRVLRNFVDLTRPC